MFLGPTRKRYHSEESEPEEAEEDNIIATTHEYPSASSSNDHHHQGRSPQGKQKKQKTNSKTKERIAYVYSFKTFMATAYGILYSTQTDDEDGDGGDKDDNKDIKPVPSIYMFQGRCIEAMLTGILKALDALHKDNLTQNSRATLKIYCCNLSLVNELNYIFCTRDHWTCSPMHNQKSYIINIHAKLCTFRENVVFVLAQADSSEHIRTIFSSIQTHTKIMHPPKIKTPSLTSTSTLLTSTSKTSTSSKTSSSSSKSTSTSTLPNGLGTGIHLFICTVIKQYMATDKTGIGICEIKCDNPENPQVVTHVVSCGIGSHSERTTNLQAVQAALDYILVEHCQEGKNGTDGKYSKENMDGTRKDKTPPMQFRLHCNHQIAHSMEDLLKEVKDFGAVYVAKNICWSELNDTMTTTTTTKKKTTTTMTTTSSTSGGDCMSLLMSLHKVCSLDLKFLCSDCSSASSSENALHLEASKQLAIQGFLGDADKALGRQWVPMLREPLQQITVVQSSSTSSGRCAYAYGIYVKDNPSQNRFQCTGTIEERMKNKDSIPDDTLDGVIDVLQSIRGTDPILEQATIVAPIQIGVHYRNTLRLLQYWQLLVVQSGAHDASAMIKSPDHELEPFGVKLPPLPEKYKRALRRMEFFQGALQFIYSSSVDDKEADRVLYQFMFDD